MSKTEKRIKINIFLGMVLFLVGLLFCSSAQAATQIYRSVGPGNTSDLNTSVRTLTVSGTTATFSGAMPDNVGVGDVLQYDPGSGLVLAFISGRTSSAVFTVQSASGGAPTAASAGTAVSVFRAYTSLAEAEAGTENSGIDAGLVDFDTWTDGKNLVSSDEQWNIACYADAEDTTTGITIEDWTTDADNFIKIYTPHLTSEVGTSQRHSGVWNDSKYKIVAPDDYPNLGDNPLGIPLGINNVDGWNKSVNVWLDGLQLFANSIMNTNAIEIYNITGTTKISNCIIKSDPNLPSSYGINIHNQTHIGTVKMWNNIIYGFVSGGVDFSPNHTSPEICYAYAYNNTVVGNGSGDGACYNHGAEGTFTAKNNIAQSCLSGFGGDFDASSDYNLSDLSDTPGSNSVNLSTLTFSDAANGNYRLSSSDTDAINQGTDLSADANIAFSSDIKNGSRGSLWDIGADEYGAIADNTAPVATQVTPVTAISSNNIPSYTFSSTEVGTITYGGGCSSATTTAVSGSNTITFSTLTRGASYSCVIYVTDTAGNQSVALNATAFAITYRGDVDTNRVVNINDFSLFADDYGKTSYCGHTTDINGDCSVNTNDFTIFADDYGKSF